MIVLLLNESFLSSFLSFFFLFCFLLSFPHPCSFDRLKIILFLSIPFLFLVSFFFSLIHYVFHSFFPTPLQFRSSEDKFTFLYSFFSFFPFSFIHSFFSLSFFTTTPYIVPFLFSLFSSFSRSFLLSFLSFFPTTP